MKLTKNDVERVAALAGLAVSRDELESMVSEMGEIIAFFDALREAETDGVEPAFRVLRREDVLRRDEPAEMLSVDDALANAPDRRGDYFGVPAFVPEEKR